MREPTYILYEKMVVELSGFLLVGGEEEDDFSLAMDGSGNYIIPAASIAGALRAYLSASYSGIGRWFGERTDKESHGSESCVYFYDAICKDIEIEKRNGIQIDGALGTETNLFTQYVIGQGMTTELRMQAFLKDENECGIIKELLIDAAAGIQEGHLTFGAKKSNGGGIFNVIEIGNKILKTSNKADFMEYLKGPDFIFEQIKCNKYHASKACGIKDRVSKFTEFELTAEIPDGIIVKSDEKKASVRSAYGKREVNSVNVKKTVDGKLCYYIPSSTIKGALKGYGKKAGRYLGITEEETEMLFGGEVDGIKYRSHVRAQDVLLEDANTSICNRIQIDRWLGSIIEGANSNQEILSTKEGKCIHVRVTTDGEDKRKRNLLNALVFLALRDLGLGLVPIGSGSAVGLGRLNGKSLGIDGVTVPFSKQGVLFKNTSEDEEALKRKVLDWLEEVKTYADKKD